MSSLRLEEKTVEIDGKEYVLRCNMAVLEALQEAHEGNFSEVLNMPAMQGMVEIFAAMLTDYAEEKGWETWTPKKVRKTFSYATLQSLDILGMFTRAVIPPEPNEAPNPPKEKEEDESAGN